MNLITLCLLLAAQEASAASTTQGSSETAYPAAAPATNADSSAVSQSEPAAVAPLSPPASFLLPRDTPVHLMTLTEVSTKTNGEGHHFKLRVNEDVILNGQTAIPKGTLAWGEVTSAESSGNLGKAGSLTARLLYIDLNGQRVKIEGDTSAKGRTATAETIVGVLGLGIFGLFAKGNNAKIKAGEKITAFVAENVELERPAN